MSKRDVQIDMSGGPIESKIEVFELVGTTAFDLWDDSDDNGRPDDFLRRLKKPNQAENEYFEVGSPDDLEGKVLQWIWMISRPEDVAEWEVAIHLQQDNQTLFDEPVRISNVFPDDRSYILFETWCRFVDASDEEEVGQ